MNEKYNKIKSIVALLFAVSLLLAFFTGCTPEERRDSVPVPGSSAVISVDGDFSPFLPAGETELEKLSSLFQRPVLSARRTFRFDVFSILLLVLPCVYARAFFPCLDSWRFYSDSDQFRQSMITYIYHKGDWN